MTLTPQGQSTVNLLPRRLVNQRLARPDFRTAADVVAWLGAVQAQDYPAARWAVGLRAKGLTDADVQCAFDNGAILRTHILRPTWHFVTPADIRWMLSLSGPRVNAINAHYYGKLEIDATVAARSRRVLDRALGRGEPMTRAELGAALARGGIAADPLRLAHLMMRAELDGVICSGPRRANQFTYALLDQRAARASDLTRDEALAELTRRYFTSHGPATVRDYAWWSGLTVGDARRGIETMTTDLRRDVVADRTYWSARASTAGRGPSSAYLLPNFDEYTVAYKDRDDLVRPPSRGRPGPRASDLLANAIVIDGRVAGTWTKSLQRGAVRVLIAPHRRLTPAGRRAVAAAASRYGRFLGLPARVSTTA
jgi:winged helix DNA-binding protein